MNLIFRKAKLEDSLRILEWRNDIETRANSLQQNEIKPEEHQEWFRRSLVNPNRLIYMVEDDAAVVGVIRTDTVEGERELSWIISPDHRGRGYGKKMLSQFVATHPYQYFARIRKQNEASLKMAFAAGFLIDQELEEFFRLKIP